MEQPTPPKTLPPASEALQDAAESLAEAAHALARAAGALGGASMPEEPQDAPRATRHVLGGVEIEEGPDGELSIRRAPGS